MVLQIEIELIKESIGYSSHDLVKRAVRNAMPHTIGPAGRWVAIRDTFAVGSAVAREICKAYGLDPHEKVRGVRCPS
ncbi:MAG: hypothetical protein BA864_05025, partial [Desulfuromonadales bacterium C00003093]